MTDRDLLQAYARTRADADFAALVSRYVDFVYGAALRQTRNHVLAQEVAQAVFLELALRANRLRNDTVLASWLCVVTRRKAVDAIRREARTRRRHETAAALQAMNADETNWETVEPVIDEALAALEEADRRAVLGRFFEGKSLREVGSALGVSDDAAQKRVSRALDRLRELLRKRGITTTAAALGTGLAANAQIAAPAGVSAAICTTVPLGLGALGAGAAGGSFSFVFMTTAQKLLLGSAAVLAIGGVLFQSAVVRSQREEIRGLQDSLHHRESEIARLHDAMPAFRPQTVESPGAVLSSEPKDALALHIEELGRRVAALREMLALAPEQRIPELERLSDDDWVAVAMERDLVTAEDFRRSFSALRSKAKMKVWGKIAEALHDYVNGHSGDIPSSLDVLRGALPGPLEVQALARYEVVAHGNILDLEKSTVLVREKADQVIDPTYEQAITYSWRSTRLSNPRHSSRDLSPDDFRFREAVNFAAAGYQRANGGAKPAKPNDLLPYFRDAADADRFRAQMETMKRPKG